MTSLKIGTVLIYITFVLLPSGSLGGTISIVTRNGFKLHQPHSLKPEESPSSIVSFRPSVYTEYSSKVLFSALQRCRRLRLLVWTLSESTLSIGCYMSSSLSCPLEG